MLLVLQNDNNYILNIIEEQQYIKETIYIDSPYLISVYDKGNKVTKNKLTEEVVITRNIEEEDLEYLVKHWFKIPIFFDIYTIYQKLQQKGNISQNNINNTHLLDNIKHAVILTTFDCNAKCYYCYEKDQLCNRDLYLSEKDADKFIARLIKNQTTKISIGWFGGEPLVNKKIISYISQKLKDNNIDLTSSMITNGILFDEETIKQAIKLWNLKSLQITFDATGEAYEKIKQVQQGSYDRLIKNVILLLDNNIKISIRLNLSLTNRKELKKVIYDLYNRVGKRKGFTIGVHELFGLEYSEQIYEDLEKLETLIKQLFGENSSKPYNWRNSGCMADKGEAIVLLPNGKVSICEHCLDHSFVTDLDESFYNVDVINQYAKISDREECKYCFLRPGCIYSEGCEASGGQRCSIYRQNYIKRQQKQALFDLINKKRKRRTHQMIERKMYTNLEIYNMGSELIKHFGGDNADNLVFPIKFSFYFQKNMKVIVEAAQDIETRRVEIIKKYGNASDDEPTNFIIPEDKFDEATKEVNELFELEQEIPVYMASLDSLGDITMTPAQVSAISFMIQEEE